MPQSERRTPAPMPVTPTRPVGTARVGLRRPARQAQTPAAQSAAAKLVPAAADSPSTAVPVDTAPQRPRYRWAAALGVLAAIVVGAILINPPPRTAISEPMTGPSYLEIRGFLVLAPDQNGAGVLTSMSEKADGTGQARCWGQSKYRDVVHGTAVTVYDDQDVEIANGQLGLGRSAEIGATALTGGTCLFPIVVTHVPVTSGFYQIEVARLGAVTIENQPKNGVLFAYLSLGGSAPPGEQGEGPQEETS